MRRLLVLPLLALVVFACSTRTRRDADSRLRTVLEVDNRSTLDVTIYVIEFSGVRTRLGNVVAHTIEHLTIPARMMSIGIVPLQFQADPVGGNAQPVTQSINVQPGDTVTMIVPIREAALR
jgi:hypothetical protein